MVLQALPVSPGCCSSVIVLLKQGTDVWQTPGLQRQAAFGMQDGCDCWRLWPGAGVNGQSVNVTFQGPELKGYHCYLHAFPTASHDLVCGVIRSGPRHRQKGWDMLPPPCQWHPVSKDWKFTAGLLFLVGLLTDGKAHSALGWPG